MTAVDWIAFAAATLVFGGGFGWMLLSMRMMHMQKINEFGVTYYDGVGDFIAFWVRQGLLGVLALITGAVCLAVFYLFAACFMTGQSISQVLSSL